MPQLSIYMRLVSIFDAFIFIRNSFATCVAALFGEKKLNNIQSEQKIQCIQKKKKCFLSKKVE